MNIGVKDLHLAILTQDDDAGVAYEAPLKIKDTMKISMNPKAAKEKIYADNKVAEILSSFESCDVEIAIKDLPLSIRAKFLGHKMENGVMIESKSDTPPDLAMGFISNKSNKKNRYVWLLKGQAELYGEDHETEENQPKPQHPKIKFTFYPRGYDEEWRRIADEDEVGYVSATGTNWFKNVPGEVVTP